MAVDQNVDPMAYLEEAMKPTPKATGDFKPFPWKGPADGEKALIRPLLNMLDYVEVYKHEYYDKPTNTWKFRALCPANLGLECQTCLDVEAMPENTKEEKAAKYKSRATRRFILPIYLHAIVNKSTGLQVTYKNQNKEDVPVCGPRILEMKPEYSTILHDLLKAFNHPMGGHDIRAYDFKIDCTLVDGFPKYDTDPKPPEPFTIEVPSEYLSKERVFDLYAEVCPPKLVSDDKPAEPVAPAKPASTNGKVRNAPDF